MARSDHSDRDKHERIKRLRERLKKVAQEREQDVQFIGVLRGILDLLADEL